MKFLNLLSFLFILPCLSKAQTAADTAKLPRKYVFTSVEMEPEFPGGVNTFYRYINTNVKYPEVARLLGINGKVFVSFWVDKSGRVVDVETQPGIGAGCEYEAKKVVSNCPRWRPGIQNGRPVRVQFNAHVDFNLEKKRVSFKELKDSHYGFVFNIDGTLCTLDEAQAKLGDTFRQSKIETAEVFYNPDGNTKFDVPDKKEVYVVKIKS